MRPQDAQKIGEQLSAYLDGELSDVERDAVEALVARDADGQALLEELREASGAVRALPRDRAPASILEQINTRLERSELLGPADRKVTLARHKRRPIRSTLAMAASLLFVVTGGLWIYFRVADTQEQASDKLAVRYESPFPEPATDMPVLQDDLRRLGGRMSVQESSPALSDEDAERLTSLGYLGVGGSQPESDLADQSAPQEEIKFAQSEARGQAIIDTVGSTGAVVGVPIRAIDSLDGGKAAAAGRFEFESATLEQKLAAGDGLDAVATHRFDAEPLQLQLIVDSRHRSQVESTLVSVLAGSGAISLDSIGMKESTAPASVAFYDYGSPGDNYAPGAAPQKQILARVSPRAIERILQTAAAQDSLQGVRFGVGQMSAEGVDESMRIARLVLPDVAAGAEGAALGEASERGGFGGGGLGGGGAFRGSRVHDDGFDGAARADDASADSQSEITGPPSDPAELLAWLFDVPRLPAATPAESRDRTSDSDEVAANERYERQAVAKSRSPAQDEPRGAVPARRGRGLRDDKTPATTQPVEQGAKPFAAGTSIIEEKKPAPPTTQPGEIDGDGTPDPVDWPLYTIVIQIIERAAESPPPAPQSQPARE